MTISVTAINDAPVLDNTKSPTLANVPEDSGNPTNGTFGSLVSTLVDLATPIGPVDNISEVDAGALVGIALVGAQTANGSWYFTTNGGASPSDWDPIGSVSDSNARLLAADANTRLYFRPVTNFTGTATVTFRAWDRSNVVAGTLENGDSVSILATGGTTAYSATTDTAIVTVAGDNDPPTTTDDSITMFEDTPRVLVVADFGTYADTEGTPLASVIISGASTEGTVEFDIDAGGGTNWQPVTIPQVVTLAEIVAGRLRYNPAPHGNGSPYATTTFKVAEDTAGAIASTDHTLTSNVTSVNDAPAGTTNTAISTNEDVAYAFTAADFGFTDPNDDPDDDFISVQITALSPAGEGTLRLSGTPILVNAFITRAQIDNSLFTFLPATNVNGTNLGQFSFKVRDGGGIANSGVDLDPTAKTINVDVNAINDEPTLSASGQARTLIEGDTAVTAALYTGAAVTLGGAGPTPDTGRPSPASC